MSVLTAFSLVLGLLALAVAGYLGLLGVLGGRNKPVPASDPPWLRFVVVVPAHNERDNIAATIESLLAVDYPRELFRVLVVADNCIDDTAARARDAGAEVLERHEAERRGKGFALAHAFKALLLEETWDAAVVIDADTVVSPNLLRAFHARLERGIGAVQAEYGVRNVDASWRTRLMTLALALFHGVRSEARERLCLSVGLRGNGMCFSRELLILHPHDAHGLVEDVEYGVLLGLGGQRVAYAGEATVLGEMVTSSEAAESQRRRWEGGRARLMREQVPRLLSAFVKERRLLLLDLALDLLVPPLAYVALTFAAGLLLEGALVLVRGPSLSTWVWLLGALGLGLYLGRGLLLARLGVRGLLALLWAPAYVFWKIARVRPWRADETWVRTRRESETRAARP